MKEKMNVYSKFEKRDFLFCFLMVAFPTIQFAVFWAYVNASSIIMSFQDMQGNFTLANFKTVYYAFVDQDIFGINLLESLGRSLIIWGLNVFVAMPVSFITTYILFRKIRGHYFFRICYIIPSLMGAVIWTAVIKNMLAYDGPIVKILLEMGVDLPKGAIRNGLLGAKETAFASLVTVSTLMALVGNNAVLTGAMARIPDELYESAELDGAGFWRTFFVIVFPCISSTVAMLYTFQLCGIFTGDVSVYLYSGGTGEPSMSTIGFQLFFLTYQLSLNGSMAYGYPAALGLVLTLFTLPIVIFGRKAIDKLVPNVEL